MTTCSLVGSDQCYDGNHCLSYLHSVATLNIACKIFADTKTSNIV